MMAEITFFKIKRTEISSLFYGKFLLFDLLILFMTIFASYQVYEIPALTICRIARFSIASFCGTAVEVQPGVESLTFSTID